MNIMTEAAQSTSFEDLRRLAKRAYRKGQLPEGWPRILRMQFAHHKPRGPAKAKPMGPFVVARRSGELVMVNPRIEGGARSKHTPHQGQKECDRRMKQLALAELKRTRYLNKAVPL